MPIKTFWKRLASPPAALKTAAMLLVVLAGSGATTLPEASASTISYDVNFASLGTLSSSNDQNYNLDFQLNTFGTPNNSTTLNFSDFSYGGGSGAANVGPLTDTNGLNGTSSAFTAGNSLSFRITANYTGETPDPDVFSFGIFSGVTGLNTGVSTTPTMGSASGDGFSYFTIAFDGDRPTVNTYAGTDPAFGAPTVSAVPEPSTYAMMALGVLALGLVQWRRQRGEAESGKNVDRERETALA